MISAQLPSADIFARAAVSLRQSKGPVMALFVGDSVTFGNNDNNANATGGNSYAAQLCWRSNGRIACRKNIGIPGQTSRQIVQRLADEGLALPDLDVVFLLQGTNDLIQSTATATVVTHDRRAIRAIHGRGLRAIVLAIPPNDLNGPGANALNAAKMASARAEGAIWIDPWRTIRSGTGAYLGDASSDGVHPTQAAAADAAAAILADAAIVAMLPAYGAVSQLVGGDLANPVPTSDFASTYPSGDNVVPNGWSAYGTGQTGTWTVTVAADAASGVNLATITAGPGATGAYNLQAGTFDLSMFAGQRVSFSGRLKTTGLAASGGRVFVRLIGNADAAEATGFQVAPMALLTTDGDGYFYGEAQVPAAASTVTIFAVVENVTAGGLAVTFGDMAIRPTSMQGLDIRSRRVPGKVRNLAASAALTLDDGVVLVDASAGPVTVTLPGAGVTFYGHGPYGASYQRRIPGSGLTYAIYKIDASVHAVTVAAPAGHTIEGATSISLPGQYAKAQVIAARAGLFLRTG